jgi:hypothetical protein
MFHINVNLQSTFVQLREQLIDELKIQIPFQIMNEEVEVDNDSTILEKGKVIFYWNIYNGKILRWSSSLMMKKGYYLNLMVEKN